MIEGFVHLGTRSDYSIGESLARVEHLCRTASQHGQDAVALTDLMSLAGAPSFSAAATMLGLQPIFGLEVLVSPIDPTIFSGQLFRARLLATDLPGWRRLLQLVNLGQQRARKGQPPHLTWSELLAEPRGLLYLLGGQTSEITAAILEKQVDHVDTILTRLIEVLGRDQIFITLPNPATPEGHQTAVLLQTIAEHYNVAPLAIPEVHCAAPEDDLAWQLLHRHQTAGDEKSEKVLGDLARPMAEREYLLSTEEVRVAYADFLHAVENTAVLAERCKFDLPKAPRRFPVHEFERGVDADSYIWNEAFERAAKRYGNNPARWRERLNREFRDLVEAKLTDALVCLARLDRTFEENGVLRGPGAGFLTNSLVASLLNLTNLDPLQFDLPFVLPEGPEKCVPLLELTISSNQINPALDALYDLFDGHLCAVGRWSRWTSSSALEYCLELSDQQTSLQAAKITKLAVWDKERETMALAPSGQDPDLTLPLSNVRALAWLTRRFEGRVRSLRAATAEVTFSVNPIHISIPCVQLADGTATTQWDATALETLGFGRVSFTHNSMLDLVEEATTWIREQGNRTFNPMRIAFDDAETFRLLREGNTQGIALLETPTVKRALRRVQPSDLAGLIKLLAEEARERQASTPSFAQIMLAFACAAIKAQEPAAFLAAALSHAANDPGKVTALLYDARLMGIGLSALDINLSTERWAPEGDALRPGFMMVRGLPGTAIQEIELIRREMTYSDLGDVLRRTDGRNLKKAHLEMLIRAGALDSFGASRSRLMTRLDELDPLLRPRSGQTGGEFFGRDGEWWVDNHSEGQSSASELDADDPIDWIAEQEIKTTGVLLSVEHLYFVKDFLKDARALEPAALKLKHRDSMVSLVGPVCVLQDMTRGERPHCLADMGGVIVKAHPDYQPYFEKYYNEGRHVLVTGKLERESFQWVLKAHMVESPESAARRSLRAECVEVRAGKLDRKKEKELLTLLKTYSGATPVRLSGLSPEPTRLQKKIATRQITLCPGLELGLHELLGSSGWQPHVPGLEKSAERKRETQKTSV